MRRGLGWFTAAGLASAAVFVFACSDSPGGVEETPAATADAASATVTPDAATETRDTREAGADLDAGGAGDATVDAEAVDAGDAGDAMPAATPAVRWVGRFETSDALGPKVAWPGARVVVRFSGTALRVKLAEQAIFGSSRYDVVVDGATAAAPLVTTGGTADYVLAEGLAQGEHVVELVRRTEALVGVTQFLGFEYPNGGALLAPLPTPARRIEFLGDSASNGYGVECASPADGFSAATENERKSYAALAAASLGADHHNLSFAGKGVLRNYDADDAQTYATLYPRTLPETPGSAWTFASFPAHVVWITLGGNDWDNPGDRPAPDLAAFQTKYGELVAVVRAAHPAAQIVLAVSASLSDDYPPAYNAFTNMQSVVNAVRNARVAAGDANVHVHVFTRSSYPTDVTGCEFHPNAALHAKLALEVSAKIKAVTGWP